MSKGFKSRALLGAVFTAAMLAHSAPTAAHPSPFTLDEVMGAPFPSDLIASKSTPAVAWVFSTRGVRNVWVAGASGKAAPVTNFTLDGFDIGELTWSRDGQLIAFTRGQTLEDPRPANAANAALGATSREVWITTPSGDAHRLGSGSSPVISPDARRVLFVDGGQLFSASTAGSPDLQTLVVDSGALGPPVWSPAGDRIAFISDRGEHALVGVYTIGSQTLTWLAPSLDHDSAPVFSPDGSRVAFIRTPTQKHPGVVPQRTGELWSIWTADATTGEGHRAWVADEGRGSVFQPTLSTQNLLWTDDNQLVFPWEKTGWLQLYAAPPSGGVVRALTSGESEIASFTLGADGRSVVYASNQGDIDRAHVWSVADRGGASTALGNDHAIEAFPTVSAGGSVYALQSDGRHALHPAILQGGAWRPVAPDAIPADFPSAKLTEPQSLTFTARDGHIAHAQIFLPTDASPGPHPAVVFFHGGPDRQMLDGFHPMGAYNWMYAENQYLAGRGYIVLSVNYRGGIGYGLDYRVPDAFGPDGASELNDLLGAADYLKSRKDVDAKRIGIWGASYGGLMTALGLARDSKDFAAGVDYAGVYDWSTFLTEVGAPADGPAAVAKAVSSSPMATIDQWTSPVLVIQADDDRNVPYAQSAELALDLRAHKIPHDEIVIPNEVHDLARYASWVALFGATNRYFEHKFEDGAGDR